MKIIVCTKIVPSYEDVLPDDWKLWGDDKLDLRYVKKVYSCFDEAALETALRLRQQLMDAGETVELCAVSIAGEATEEHLLTQLYAVGFDQVVQIVARSDFSKEPQGMAGILCDYIRVQEDVRLVVCGERADPANWGQTGIRIAHTLGMPCFTGVTDVFYDGYMQITRKADWLTHTLTAEFPLVLTMGNTTAAFLRLPTLRQKLQAKSKIVEKLERGTCGSIEEKLVVKALYTENREKKCQFIEGATGQEKVKVIYDLLKSGGDGS